MTSSLDIVKATVAKPGNGPYVRNGTSYCQTFAGNCWETFFGRPTPNSYPSAAAAYRASTIVSKDYNAAPPGAYHYFTYGSAGHVGFALGSGLMASGTGWVSKAVANMGKNVLIHRVADYAAHLPYLGWAYTNGARAQITGLTDENAQPTLPNQRKVGGTETRRRAAPSTSAAYNGDNNLAPGTIVTPEGWVNGEAVNSNPVWFKIGSLFSHSGAFTNPATAGLSDLNSYPNQRVVLTGIGNTRVRVDASTSATQTGELAEGAKVPVTRYKKGQLVTVSDRSTDIWYEVPDGFAWAGSFTSQSLEGLAEIVPDVPVPPVDKKRTAVLATNVRKYPRTGALILSSVVKDTVIDVEKFTVGDSVTSSSTGAPITSNIWYGTGDGWAWAGGFNSQSTEGLEAVDVSVPPDTNWPATKYGFTADFPTITNRVVPADWSNFENEWSTPVAAGRKGFPIKPEALVAHQWGEPGKYTIDSVINTALGRHETSQGRMAPHFVVNGNEIVQMVSLKDRAFHAGSGGNDFVGIEIDPLMTPEVIANVVKLEEALRDKYGYVLAIKYHKDLEGAATSCGTFIQPHEAALTISELPPVDPTLPNEIEELLAQLNAQIAELVQANGQLVNQSASLVVQLTKVTGERDALQAKVDAAKAALE